LLHLPEETDMYSRDPKLGVVFVFVTAALLGACYGGSNQAGYAHAPAYGLSYYGGPVVSTGNAYLATGPASNPRWSAEGSRRRHRHEVEYGHTGVYGGGPADDHHEGR
jgi:hypothetical protein